MENSAVRPLFWVRCSHATSVAFGLALIQVPALQKWIWFLTRFFLLLKNDDATFLIRLFITAQVLRAAATQCFSLRRYPSAS
ncbi:hypothetical protein SRHO_G00243890 [Serrasalmus rhombeus]